MKWSCKSIWIVALGFCLLSLTYKIDGGYTELIRDLNVDAKAYDEMYLMHFDFCSTETKCRDTLEMQGFFSNPKTKVALIVDTLYSSILPDYIDRNRTDIYYVNRVWLQRKGIYTERQQKLVLSRKGEIKRRILLK